MKSILNTLFFTFLFFTTQTTFGQVSGQVTDAGGDAIPGINIVHQSKGTGASTNESGKYILRDLNKGEHSFVVSGVGYETQVIKVNYKGRPVNYDIQLKENTTTLEAVVVEGKSEFTEKKELPYAVSVVDVKPLKMQNLDVNQVLGRISGVRIREDGGLGSNFNFTLNGFSGNQVKFFLDGIPMDNFGSSLTMNNIPVNLISGIEVYKGVVPVHLGSDALGGAINIVTNNGVKDYLNVSYSFGSFNTHRASVVSRITNESGFLVNANGFFNYSDNNYKVEVSVPDPVSGKYGDPEELERFHDAYRSQTIQLEAGFENKKFADQLLFGLIASGNHKEIQVGSNMNKPIGEAYTTDKAIIPTLKYKKQNFLTNGLTFTMNSAFNIRQSMRVDTASKIYDWYGNFTYRGVDVTSGEISWDKTKFRFNDRSVMVTGNFIYELGKHQTLSLNNTYSWYRRVGEDPISYNAVPFSEPNFLTKNVTGLSYSVNLFNEKLRTVVFGKWLMLDALMREDANSDSEFELATITNHESYGGYGIASTYFFLENIQIKFSYENTYRLPEVYEMFGDGLLLQSSSNIKAEKSQNFNVGILGRHRINRHEFLFEASYLYRLPENLIRNVATGVTSVYENLQSAKANIIEGGVKYRYSELLHFEVNGTYQNIVNNQEFTSTGGINYLYGDRLPNTPFLFANAQAGVLFDKVGLESGKLGIDWSTQFVEAFYLKWPSQGSAESKYDIPRQLSHNLSTSYSLEDGKYNVSLACTNIFDSKLYDNFMLQKPGRAFNVKLSYFLQ